VTPCACQFTQLTTCRTSDNKSSNCTAINGIKSIEGIPQYAIETDAPKFVCEHSVYVTDMFRVKRFVAEEARPTAVELQSVYWTGAST
jgi:hypothetical protein